MAYSFIKAFDSTVEEHPMIKEIFAALIPQGNKALNTKKIDKNIDTLLQYRWFEDLYDDEKYRKLFFTNRKNKKLLGK